MQFIIDKIFCLPKSDTDNRNLKKAARLPTTNLVISSIYIELLIIYTETNYYLTYNI